jgi:hypothetical protein
MDTPLDTMTSLEDTRTSLLIIRTLLLADALKAHVLASFLLYRSMKFGQFDESNKRIL